MTRLAALILLAALVTTAQETNELVNRGVQAFKSAKYTEAVQYFSQAAARSPYDKTAHLYLATAWMSQYIPGADTPENLAVRDAADQAFRRVLELDAANELALESLATLHYNMAQGNQPLDAKLRHLDDAAGWYNKLLAVNASSKTAHYSLAVITWAQFYPELMQARRDAKMRPEDPGPLRDATARLMLRARYDTMIAEAIHHLDSAIQLDPEHDDAMAYMNLLVRERADFADTKEDYDRQIAVADEWVEKALATKKLKAERVAGATETRAVPKQIRVGAIVQAAKLTRKPTPQYPAEAIKARIQGRVVFNVTIAKDGSPQKITLVSGHPLFVTPATEAVQGYLWQPTLLNGEPVEVLTQVEVTFTLTP